MLRTILQLLCTSIVSLKTELNREFFFVETQTLILLYQKNHKGYFFSLQEDELVNKTDVPCYYSIVIQKAALWHGL